MYIIEFLEILKSIPENTIIRNVDLKDYGSDRGNYEDFYLGEGINQTTTAKDIIAFIEIGVLGREFTGYKGGKFLMEEYSEIRLGTHGMSGYHIDGILFEYDIDRVVANVKPIRHMTY